MSEIKYFTRKVAEGTVKVTHNCSFDNGIVLTKLVQKGVKVIDSVILNSASVTPSKGGKITSADLKEKKEAITEELRNRISAIRINGLPIVLEDLGECFDDDEIVEVIAFINDADMSVFGGKAKTENEEEEDALKNA